MRHRSSNQAYVKTISSLAESNDENISSPKGIFLVVKENSPAATSIHEAFGAVGVSGRNELEGFADEGETKGARRKRRDGV